ncbi:MAG: hypothetical protein ABIV36_06955 [Sphingobium limneticum]
MTNRTMETATVSLSPWIEAAVVKYGWIWVGVGFGFAAKYGLLMKRGKPVTVRMIVADMLLIGMVVLIAFNIIVKFGLHGEAAALVTSLVAVGADRGIRLLTDRFWRQVDAALPDMAQLRGEIRQADQIDRSRAALTGAADCDGDDLKGVHIHRLPATPKSEEP